MSGLFIGIGELTIESRKCPLRIDSEVTVGFKTSQADLPVRLSESLGFSSVGFLNQDHWIRRVQHLQILFRVMVTSGLSLSKKCETSLAEALKQSVVTAKLWEQLELELLHDRVILEESVGTGEFQLLISLRELRQHNHGDRADGNHFIDSDGRLNLQAPLSIPSHQLTSICYKISFAPVLGNTVTLCKRTKRSERDCQLATCIQLVDSVLRSSIAYKPTQMFGVKIGARQQPHSLSVIAPSTFIPGYAHVLANRAKLIEPIVKFLSVFKSRTYLNHALTENDDPRVEDEAVKQSSNSKIEADLWITMANALKNDYHARRLQPLKSSFEVLGAPNQDFEELHHLQEHKDAGKLEDATMLEDDLTDDEQLLFDMFEMYSINDSSAMPRLIEHTNDSWPKALSSSSIGLNTANIPVEEMMLTHDDALLLSELSDAERCRSEAGINQHTIKFVDAADTERLEPDIIDLELSYRDKPSFIHTNQTRSDEDMLDVWPRWTKNRINGLDADRSGCRNTGQMVDTGSDEEEMFLDTWKDSLEARDMLL